MNSSLKPFRLRRPQLAPRHWGGVVGAIGILFAVLVLVFMPDSEWLWTMRALYASGLLFLSFALAVAGGFALRFLWYLWRKVHLYERLFSVAKHTEERRTQVETVLKQSAVWSATFSPIRVLCSRGRLYVKFQCTEDSSIENHHLLLLCDKADLYTYGWFVVLQVNQLDFLAVEHSNVDSLWRGEVLGSRKSEVDPPPEAIGFVMGKEPAENVRNEFANDSD